MDIITRVWEQKHIVEKPKYLYNYTKNYINKTGILFQWHT